MSREGKSPESSNSFLKRFLKHASQHDAYTDFVAEPEINHKQSKRSIKGVVSEASQASEKSEDFQSVPPQEALLQDRLDRFHAHSNHGDISADFFSHNPGELYFGNSSSGQRVDTKISKEALQESAPKALQVPANALIRQIVQNATLKSINEGLPGLVATAKSQPKYFTMGWMSRVPYNLFGINTALNVLNTMQNKEGDNNVFSNPVVKPAIAAATEYGAGFVFEFSSLYSGIYSEKAKSMIMSAGTKTSLGKLSEIGFGSVFIEVTPKEADILFAKHKEYLLRQGLRPSPQEDIHSFMNSRKVATAIAEKENFRFCDFASKGARKTLEGTLNIRIDAKDISRAFAAGSLPGAFRNLPFYVALLAGGNASDTKKVAIAVAGGVVTTIPNNISSIAMQEAAKGKPVLEALTKASKISIDQFRTSKAAASIGVGARILANLAAIEIYGQSSTAKIQELTGLVYDLFVSDIEEKQNIEVPTAEIAPELEQIDECCNIIQEEVSKHDSVANEYLEAKPSTQAESVTAESSVATEKVHKK